MAKYKKSTDPTLTGFYKAMERTNVEKITDVIFERELGLHLVPK
jgi:hypothetical protein